MKKVTVLSLVFLATVLLTFASSTSRKKSIINNKRFLNETETEAKIDLENEETYSSLIKDFKIIFEVESEKNIDEQNDHLYGMINYDFDNLYIKETIKEEQNDIINNELYNNIIEDIN